MSKNDKTATSNTNNPFVPTGKGGSGVSLTSTLTLSKDAHSNYTKCPRQVQLVLNYLHEMGGSASVKELNDFATLAEGTNTWCRPSGELYEQTPAKILQTYITAMKGERVWNKKGDQFAVIPA